MFHPEEATMLQLQAHIEQILKSSKLSEDEKIRLLREAKYKLRRVKESLNPMVVAQAEQTMPSEVLVLQPPTPHNSRASTSPSRSSSGTTKPFGEKWYKSASEGENEQESDIPPAPPLPTPPPLAPAKPPLALPVTPPQVVRASSTSSSSKNIFSNLEFKNQYSGKFERFQSYLNKHPGVIDRTDGGEALIDGHVVEGSKFDDLIRDIFIPAKELKKIGQTRLAAALTKIGMDPEMVSSGKFKTLMTHPSRNSPPSQGGKGFPKRKRGGKPIPDGKRPQFAPPPGKRPKILFLYR